MIARYQFRYARLKAPSMLEFKKRTRGNLRRLWFYESQTDCH